MIPHKDENMEEAVKLVVSFVAILNLLIDIILFILLYKIIKIKDTVTRKKEEIKR